MFGARTRLTSQLESASIFRQITQALFLQLFMGVVAVALILLLEHWFVSAPPKFDSEVLKELLSVTAQIAGIFLALYFTAVSVVASTGYARVPGDVRTLLTREKVGNVYIRTVAFLAMLCLLLLGALALGFRPGVLGLAIVLFLAVVSVLSFLVLGLRIFNFFDPTRLVGYLQQDFSKWASRAAVSGFRWDDPAFQAHYQRRAEQVLETYRRVVAHAERTPDVEGRVLAELATNALQMLAQYGRAKLRIPINSHWFRRVYEHRDWLTADHTRTELALQTGTGLHPDPVPDPLWVESEVAKLVAEVLSRLVDARQFRDAVEVTETVGRVLGLYGRNLAVEEALKLQSPVSAVCRKLGRHHSVEIEGTEEREQEFSLVLGLTDSYSAGLLSLLLGVSENLRGLNAESFASQVDSVRWGKPKSTYTGRFPRKILEQVEYLAKGIDVEYRLEGGVVSPPWFQHQIAALGGVRLIDTISKLLVEELNTTFPAETERLVKELRFPFAAQLIHRGLEACNKFAAHYEDFEKCFERLNELRRVSDIPWPSVDWASHQSAIESSRERLVVSLGQSAAGLRDVPRSRYWPDYFGHACLFLARECYQAMANGNEDLSRKLFAAYFLVALAAYDRLRQELQGADEQSVIVYSTEPIANLLELSGWAIIYSELDSRGFWQFVQEIWEKFLDGRPEVQATTEFLNAMVNYREGVFAILPGDLTRSAWKQDFAGRLHERGLISEDELLFADRPRASQHPSLIVRAVSRGGGYLLSDPEDVFMATYLLKRPEASTFTPSNKVQGFIDALELEEEQGEGEDNDEDME